MHTLIAVAILAFSLFMLIKIAQFFMRKGEAAAATVAADVTTAVTDVEADAKSAVTDVEKEVATL